MARNYDGPGNQGSGRIFDEFAKLMTDAAGVAQGAKRDVETAFMGQAERVLDHLEVVQRDEFEAVKEMAARARTEATDLRAELDALKKQVAALSKSAPAKSASAKSASAKSAPAKSAPAKSAPAKSAPAKSAKTKASAAKPASTKQAAPKKAAVKKPAAKKPAARKTAAKKPQK